MIFVLKFFLIAAAVVMSFFGVQYFHTHWFVGLFNMAVALYACVVFLALYDHAFAIPVNAADVRMMAQLTLLSQNGGWQKQKIAVLKRELRSFPMMGIRVGHFYHLERESTPKFLDFAATQTFNMLVTFR